MSAKTYDDTRPRIRPTDGIDATSGCPTYEETQRILSAALADVDAASKRVWKLLVDLRGAHLATCDELTCSSVCVIDNTAVFFNLNGPPLAKLPKPEHDRLMLLASWARRIRLGEESLETRARAFSRFEDSHKLSRTSSRSAGTEADRSVRQPKRKGAGADEPASAL